MFSYDQSQSRPKLGHKHPREQEACQGRIAVHYLDLESRLGRRSVCSRMRLIQHLESYHHIGSHFHAGVDKVPLY